ncbi:unnamed protein product [Ixodes hexagonus]
MAGMDNAADIKSLVGRPVTVIRANGEGGLTVDHRAIRSILLQQDVRDLPVVVVSVAGAFRTGKSSILNVLLRFPFLQYRDWLGPADMPLEGFAWKSGKRALTKGIVFWSHLFRATTVELEQVAVLLVDTQGAFDTNSSMTESVHIFALSILLSSIQVFNVMRNLQLDHLQHLQMFCEYGKLAQELKGGCSNLQHCVFLVRDWEWPDDNEFGWTGGEQVLRETLSVEPALQLAAALRALRTYFKTCIASRKCFLMPSPGHTDKGCRLNGPVRFSFLDRYPPSFNEHLRDFVHGVLSPGELVIKTVAGVRLSASLFCKFVEVMTPMFSSDKLPEPVSMEVS